MAAVGTAEHLDALDGMRAIAIGAVLVLHLDRAHVPGGAFGVDVFFVLSSYLISTLLLEEFGREVDLAATGLMLHTVLAARSWPSRVLGSSPFRWIGVRTYGFYLDGLTLVILVPAVAHLRIHEAAPVDRGRGPLVPLRGGAAPGPGPGLAGRLRARPTAGTGGRARPWDCRCPAPGVRGRRQLVDGP